MCSLVPIRCFTCNSVIKTAKFLKEYNKYENDTKEIFEKIFQTLTIKNPCCITIYLSIPSAVKKEEILCSYNTTDTSI